LGWPSSSRSPMRFTASLRIEAAANTITPSCDRIRRPPSILASPVRL
jgi:hypothetical protein